MTHSVSTAQQTEGPWVYLDIGEVVLADDTEVTIATIDYGRDDAEEIGQLIAAAPELLAALKAFAAPLNPSYEQVPGTDPYSAYFSVDAIRAAVAAVAKAEGRAA